MTSANGNMTFEGLDRKKTVVLFAVGINDFVLIPYYQTPQRGLLGAHVVRDTASYSAITNTKVTADVYYFELSQYSVSQYTTKSFTSAARQLRYGAVADFDTSVKYDGYTPVCFTTVKSNHTGSCIITQFGLRDNDTAYASIQNNEVTNKGTWNDFKITFVILYKKNVI